MNRAYTAVWGKDTIQTITNKLLRPSELFTGELYEKIRNCLMPSFHDLESGKEHAYNEKQKRLIQSTSSKQKIKGVAGSGKTLVLAKRAVNAHKRTNGRILILSFNITLRNYIRDRISDVRESFPWSNFQIIHYHLFIRNQCKVNGIEMNLESYGNLNLFSSVEDRIEKFDAIFIDEIQDFKYEWQHILRKYFLAEGGELVLFGDEKQNIYNRMLEQDKKVKTTIPGAWNQLNTSYRLSSRLTEIALDFQRYFFKDKYELDEIEFLEQLELNFEGEDQQLHYYYIKNPITIHKRDTAYKIIFEIIDKLGVHRNDLCFLGPKIELLRELEYYIRTVRRENTTRTFESKEVFEALGCPDDRDTRLIKLRKERKYNFWMNAGTTKLSTIHSFKGWEINNLVLFIEQDQVIQDGREHIALEELIYTGITRCRKNLIIINVANQEMNRFFKNIKNQFDYKNI